MSSNSGRPLHWANTPHSQGSHFHSVLSAQSPGVSCGSSKHSGPGATGASVVPIPQSVGIQTPNLRGEPRALLPGKPLRRPCDAVKFSGHLPQGGSSARSPRWRVWGKPGPQAPQHRQSFQGPCRGVRVSPAQESPEVVCSPPECHVLCRGLLSLAMLPSNQWHYPPQVTRGTEPGINQKVKLFCRTTINPLCTILVLALRKAADGACVLGSYQGS